MKVVSAKIVVKVANAIATPAAVPASISETRLGQRETSGTR
jgi:hypothetical protein